MPPLTLTLSCTIGIAQSRLLFYDNIMTLDTNRTNNDLTLLNRSIGMSSTSSSALRRSSQFEQVTLLRPTAIKRKEAKIAAAYGTVDKLKFESVATQYNKLFSRSFADSLQA